MDLFPVVLKVCGESIGRSLTKDQLDDIQPELDALRDKLEFVDPQNRRWAATLRRAGVAITLGVCRTVLGGY